MTKEDYVKQIKIKVDYEYQSEEFWSDFHETFPEEARELGAEDEITLDEDRAEEIQEWAEAHDDWGEGPDYAPNPLIFEEVPFEIIIEKETWENQLVEVGLDELGNGDAEKGLIELRRLLKDDWLDDDGNLVLVEWGTDYREKFSREYGGFFDEEFCEKYGVS